MFKHKLFTLILLVSTGFGAWAQATLKGVVQDAVTLKGIDGALVRLERTKIHDETGEDGSFNLSKIPKKGNYTLIVIFDGYSPVEQSVQVGKASAKGITILMRKIEADAPAGSDDLPTISLDEAESGTAGNNEVSSALGASRDIFQNAANFNLFPFRFQQRGYDGENNLLFLNYIPMNDPETGFGTFSEFGGLNDVTRSRDNSIGIEPIEYGFGGLGGSSLIDCRASRQRKQIRVGYANSNRQYDHRIMATYNTGLMANGWAVSVSGSRRWANEGYQKGTFFDGYSYFLSVDKKFGTKSLLDFTVLAAQSERGRSTGSYKEMFDLTGDKYYNPNWGYQQGEIRNSSIARQHQPIAIMRFDHDFSEKTKWITAASFQTGARGLTGIDWYNANDPRPDYYKNMPSYVGASQDVFDTQRAENQARFLAEDEANRQVNWDGFYYQNRANIVDHSQYNPAAVGAQSLYILADRRQDNTEANLNSIFNHAVNDRFTVQGGGTYQYYKGENFNIVEDLLGGDFYMNWDKYAERDQPLNEDFKQNDVLNPNRAVKQGERFGFDYDEHIRNASGWVQGQLVLSKVDLFASVTGGQTQFWRDGNVQNGKFPDNSYGKGKVHSFPTYGVKAGLTYKVTGAHYVYGHVGSMERAPQFRNSYLSVRTRDFAVPDLETEKIKTAEIGYLLRTPYWKARLSGYFTTIKDQVLTRSLLINNVFGNTSLTGMDEQHAGIELGLEAKLTTSMTVQIAATAGDHIFTSNPLLYEYEDNDGQPIVNGLPTYYENLRTRGPQSAATVTIRYDLPKHTFVNVSGNWASESYYDMLPIRHSGEAVAKLDDFPELRSAALAQDKAPAAYTLDFFGGKSWKINRNFLYLNIGVSNILNNRYQLGGWESARVNTRLIPTADMNASSVPAFGLLNKTSYANGITWFAGLTYKL